MGLVPHARITLTPTMSQRLANSKIAMFSRRSFSLMEHALIVGHTPSLTSLSVESVCH